MRRKREIENSLTLVHKNKIGYQDIYTPAAKIHFEYNIYRESDGELVATGYSIQVFLNWQKKWKLTE